MSEQLVRKTIHIDAADVERADRVVEQLPKVYPYPSVVLRRAISLGLDQIEQELVDGVIRLRKEDNRGQ